MYPNKPAKSQFLAQQAANNAMLQKPAILPRFNPIPASISGAQPKTVKPYNPTPSVGSALGGIVGGARDVIKGAHEGAVNWVSNQMTEFANAYGGGGQQPNNALPNTGGGGNIKPVPTPQSIPAPNTGGGGNDQPQINAGSQGGVMVGPNGEVKAYTKDMIDQLANRNTYSHDAYMKSLPQAQAQQAQPQAQQRAGLHMFNPGPTTPDFSTGDSSFDKRHGLEQRAQETARMNADTNANRLDNTRAIAEGDQAVDREQMDADAIQVANQAAYDKDKYLQTRSDKNTQFNAKLANQLGDRMNKSGFWELKRRIDSAPPELKQGYMKEFESRFDFPVNVFNDFIEKGTKKSTDDDMGVPILPPAQ